MDSKNISILKFGGTSMGTAESMKLCMELAMEKIKQGKYPFFVVSAISKMTDSLLKMLEFAKNKRKKDMMGLFISLEERHFDILNNLTNNQSLIDKYTKILNKKFLYLINVLNGILLIEDYSDKTQASIASLGEELSSDLMECCLIENNIKAKKISAKNFVVTDGNYLSANVDFGKTKKKFKKILNEVEHTTFVMTGFLVLTLKKKFNY
jgi:aspartate kinase